MADEPPEGSADRCSRPERTLLAWPFRTASRSSRSASSSRVSACGCACKTARRASWPATWARSSRDAGRDREPAGAPAATWPFARPSSANAAAPTIGGRDRGFLCGERGGRGRLVEHCIVLSQLISTTHAIAGRCHDCGRGRTSGPCCAPEVDHDRGPNERAAAGINRRALAGVASVIATLIAVVALGLAAFSPSRLFETRCPTSSSCTARLGRRVELVRRHPAPSGRGLPRHRRRQLPRCSLRSRRTSRASAPRARGADRPRRCSWRTPSAAPSSSSFGANSAERRRARLRICLRARRRREHEGHRRQGTAAARGRRPSGPTTSRASCRLDPDGFQQFFAADVDPAQARVMAAVQKPIASSELMSERAFGVPAWKSRPSWFLVTEQDQMLLPDAQRGVRQAHRAADRRVAGGEPPPRWSLHPDEVAAFIMKACRRRAAPKRQRRRRTRRKTRQGQDEPRLKAP